MRRILCFLEVLALAVLFGPTTGSAADDCALANIDRVGPERLEAVKAIDGATWWVELGDQLLLCGPLDLAGGVRSLGFAVERVLPDVDRTRTYVVRTDSDLTMEASVDRVLYQRRRLAVVVLRPAAIPWEGATMHPVARQTVVLSQLDNQLPRPTAKLTESLQDLVDDVDEVRWFDDIEGLAAFNRYSPNPEILDAEEWIADVFGALPGLTVTRPAFFVGGQEVHNVVATLTGTRRPDDWIIVGGHYDSISESPWTAAPGAEDNASGCAGVLEMARVFVAHPPEATILFICYAGEEEGLVGSENHVAGLVASGDADKVVAVLDMDMIGYTADSDLDCLLETEEIGQFLIDDFAAAAQEFTSLRIVTSLYAWGSDHVPYLDRGIPALLTIENDWDQYPYYHRTGDLPVNITPSMGREILKMNVAAIGQLAGAGLGRLFTDGFESGDTTEWTAIVP